MTGSAKSGDGAGGNSAPGLRFAPSGLRLLPTPRAQQNLETAKFTASVIPGAKLSIYDGIGHSPFYEDAPRFNSELAAFVRTANKAN